jgi:hypothetical protein
VDTKGEVVEKERSKDHFRHRGCRSLVNGDKSRHWCADMGERMAWLLTRQSPEG